MSSETSNYVPDPAVDRVFAASEQDWARYCSEACQHAHWAAGHKDECPCARDL